MRESISKRMQTAVHRLRSPPCIHCCGVSAAINAGLGGQVSYVENEALPQLMEHVGTLGPALGRLRSQGCSSSVLLAAPRFWVAGETVCNGRVATPGRTSSKQRTLQPPTLHATLRSMQSARRLLRRHHQGTAINRIVKDHRNCHNIHEGSLRYQAL